MKLSTPAKVGLGFGLVFGTVFILVVGGTNYLVNHDYVPAMKAVDAELLSHKPQILADLRLLGTNPPFPDLPRKKNADDLISRNVRWDSQETQASPNPNGPRLHALFEATKNWKQDESELAKLLNDPRLAEVDTNWLESLRGYDHWDLTENKRIQERLIDIPKMNSIARIGRGATLALPDYQDLRNWGLAHVFKKAKQGDAINGLATFRHIARLVHSTNTLIGNMIATAMLKDEHALVRALRLSNWRPVEMEVVDAYKRLSWALIGVVRLPIFSQIPPEFAPYLKPATGVCAAVNESVSGVSLYEEFLKPRAPFEPDFTDSVQRNREFTAKMLTSCGLDRYAVFLSPISGNEPWLNENAKALISAEPSGIATRVASVNWSHVPYVRRAFALRLLSIATPNYTRFYAELKTSRLPATKEPTVSN